MDYIIEEPLFTLTYKQLMLSDGILDRLDEGKLLKKPKRSTKNHYKRYIIEFSDKIAVWMDTLTRFVDIQAIDGDEDIPPLTISSLGEEEEESEESSYYSELEKELWEEFGEGEGEEFGAFLELVGEVEAEAEAEVEAEIEEEIEAEIEGEFEEEGEAEEEAEAEGEDEGEGEGEGIGEGGEFGLTFKAHS